MTRPSITAAICTCGRPGALRRALASLRAQTLAPDALLVIENGTATHETARIASEAGALYLHEPQVGLDVARNRALCAASTEIVAFLDDDAVADAGWAAAFGAAFEDPGLGACTGRVEALSLERAGARLFEANGGFSRGTEPIQLPRDARRPLHGLPAPMIAWTVSIGSGCSMAVRRSAAVEAGGFDERLDRGAELPGGGDHDLLWRLLNAGWSVRYDPAALAAHEHRAEVESVLRQIAGHQKALVAFLSKALREVRGTQRIGVAAFLVWRLLKPGVRIVRRIAGLDPLPLRPLLMIWVETIRGLSALHRNAHA